MDPSTFLGKVCPDGLLVLARKVERTDPRGRTYNTFAHKVAQGPQQASTCVKGLVLTKDDVYFALASYQQGFHTVTTKAGRSKKVIRVRDNVDKLKALWFDIDFKDGYPNEREVVLALRGFCKTTNIPAPTILVHSGNGVHAYWPLAEAVPLARWQALADAFKEAAKMTGLQADLACTADACRVLRPPKTINWKDPNNPKRVKIIYADDRVFTVEELEACLLPRTNGIATKVGGKNVPVGTVNPKDFEEFTGGLSKSGTHTISASFSNVMQQCLVSQQALDTHGATASEPEWTAMLQLLRHCEDGELWLHEISSGHPDYDPDSTREKWEQRLENTAGPTLCSTLEQYHPEVCAVCPHKGSIKTPVHLGQTNNKPVVGMPPNYRKGPNGGVQLLHIDEDDGSKSWVSVLRHNIDNLSVTRSVTDDSEEIEFDIWLEGGEVKTVTYSSILFGNLNKAAEFMANLGVIFLGKEIQEFKNLMGTWIGQLQKNRKVTEVSEQLGWIITKDAHDNEVLTGFSCGDTTYYADGRQQRGVRVRKEWTNIAMYYEVKGHLTRWKVVADFIAEQNNPAFTAILATAFAAPILRFTGQVGGIFTIVSQESGVGKSSALKLAQAVWGSPTHGINSVSDTVKSVARKIGFINNLPAYWDELRGRHTIEGFLELAFQITQGKERSRLDSTATLRESRTWETMLIAASNDSIFDAMGEYGKGSDAGIARTFEIVVEPINTEKSTAELAVMFESLHTNYGHAGRVYAQYLATHTAEVRAKVEEVGAYLGKKYKQRNSERFWFAMMSVLITGSWVANKCGLVSIDTKTLAEYLGNNLLKLRGRGVESLSSNEPMELVAQYVQAHQDRILLVEAFPIRGVPNYLPVLIGSPPKSEKIIIWKSKNDRAIRVSSADFIRWLTKAREVNGHGVVEALIKSHKASKTKANLCLGTRFELPRQTLLEVPFI